MSNRIESIITQSKLYRCRPSDIIDVDDAYTAFCFNEACAAIIVHLQNGDKPHYVKSESSEEKPKTYTKFSDYVKDIEGVK